VLRKTCDFVRVIAHTQVRKVKNLKQKKAGAYTCPLFGST
jgi:hypothetical protein